MGALTFYERKRLTRLLIDRAGRLALSGVLHSPLFRWRYGAPVADELLLVPQELRTADASFAHEVRHGMFGLGGSVVSLGDGSVFDVALPSDAWARELHGFGWLRNLSASGTDEAVAFGRACVKDWISRNRTRRGLAWSADVAGRRVYSWLANAELLMGGGDQATYDMLADSLGAHLIHLSARWRDAPGGRDRLTALIGLLTGGVCIGGHERIAERAQRDLVSELQKQIHDDGGHRSRNPFTTVELLLDLLPLRTCFNARGLTWPDAIEETLPRMLRFVQFMRLGDGSLARFNGNGATPLDTLATLAAYIPDDPHPLQRAEQSAYVRLSCGDSVVLMDGGGPPALEDAAAAAAGCLSFEFSSGVTAIFVNGGAPGPADQAWLTQSRSTASHNTLVLGAQSSARIVQHRTLERLIGGPPLRMPDAATAAVMGDNDAMMAQGEHDGYRQRFGLLHQRRLRLAKSGRWLEGRDQIASAGQRMRLPRDIPFSVHFHLHPDIVCLPEKSAVAVELKLPDGAVWQFRCNDATISIEDSIHYADYVGPARSQQIVLRGSCFGDKSIEWRCERIA